MSPPEHSTKDIFAEALRLTNAAERTAYLDQACAGDLALRQEVESLLSAHAQAGDFLGHTIPLPAPDFLIERTGTMIGRYKVLQKIGEGGFGVVYMAEQVEPVQRKVALKIIKAGMDTREVIARFEAERQALALMDHPGIANILDAGATDAGRPYFVMELVNGIPITDYCDRKKLPTAERLHLFMKVCHAVQHAHQKGIIHRDLKPSNVLVTLHDGEPVPKVIDFGVVKALGQKLTQKTLFTGFQHMIGTPAYMSPEQAELSGLDVDTRSDIYSLGVLLYELLTGMTPFDKETLAKAAFDEMRRMIRETEPPKPSTRLNTLSQDALGTVAAKRQAEPTKLNRLVRGDLDWIVMKCLEKDRARRYETPNAVALDIQRHLRAETVSAAAPTFAYRAMKFARRHRMAMAGASLFIAVLLLATSISTWQAFEAQRARSAERTQRLRAEAQARIAEEGKAKFRHLDYVSTINLAQQAWEENNVARLRALLASIETYPERGFEWYYWQRQCHLELLALHAHSQVLAVAVSPDGKLIATGDTEALVKIWDIVTGHEVCTLAAHPKLVHPQYATTNKEIVEAYTFNMITSVAFSPDSQRLVTASLDSAAKVWDALNGRELLILSGHTGDIHTVAFSPDGRRILSGSSDRTARVWDTATGRELLVMRAKTGIHSAQFSPHSDRIATGGWDGTISVWEAANGRELLHFRASDIPVPGIAFSPDGKRLGTAGWDHTARIWDATTGREQLKLEGHKSFVTSVAFSPDGKRLITSSGDMTLKMWDVATGNELLTIKGHTEGIRSAAFFGDGHRVLTGSWDGTAKVWDVDAPREQVYLRGHKGSVAAVAFSPDSHRVVTGGKDGTARVWDVATATQRLNLTGHTGSVNSVAFSPNGRLVLTGGGDRTARLWDAATGEQRLVATASQGISAVAFSPDGARMATSASSTVEVWEVPTGRRLLRFPARPESDSFQFPRLVFSPDGRRLVGGCSPGIHVRAVRIWDSLTGNQLLKIEELNLYYSLALSADGQMLVTGSVTQNAELWNATDGKHIGTLVGHTDDVTAVTFLPNGSRAVTASNDQTLKVWDIASRRNLLTFRLPRSQILSRAASPKSSQTPSLAASLDGQRLAAGSADGTVTIWEAASASQVAAWQERDK